jgi:Predicted permeases
MTIQTILILLIVGIAAGVLSGLVGIGGGLIIVPALIFFLGFSQKMAQGTSLGILLLPIGVLAVLQYYKAGYVNVHTVWLVALGFLAGGYFGSKIALSLPQETVKKIFAIVLLLIAFKMLFIDKKVKEIAGKNEKVNSIANNNSPGN